MFWNLFSTDDSILLCRKMVTDETSGYDDCWMFTRIYHMFVDSSGSKKNTNTKKDISLIVFQIDTYDFVFLLCYFQKSLQKSYSFSFLDCCIKIENVV